MIFAACNCELEDGCDACGHTGTLRRCDTCGEYFPAERSPTWSDHVAPWTCPGCLDTCHRCGGSAAHDVLWWVEPPKPIERTAVHIRVCDGCLEALRVGREIAAEMLREKSTETRS